MKRTNQPNTQQQIVMSFDEEPIVLSKPLLDTFLLQPNPGNLITLYCFYYYTAKWQRTNQPKATGDYVAAGLKWGTDKVRIWKQELKRLGLIEDVVTRNEENRITGHYIKVNFVWKSTTNTEFHPMDFATPGNLPPLVKSGTNALSSNNINALSSNTLRDKLLKDIHKVEFNESSIQKGYKTYLPLAKYLSDTILLKKDIKHSPFQINSWAHEIRRLVENNGVAYDRVEQALRWYKKNIGGQYTPVIESGRSLRDKFMRLEVAMQRAEQHPDKPDHIIEYGQRWDLEEDGKYKNKAGKTFVE